MAKASSLRLPLYFATLPDPRVRGRCEHRLLDIVVIAMCAVIANCNDWQQIATFAVKRVDWFRRFLPLPHGVPSHDTFERVFDRLDPEAFQGCFRRWVRAVSAALDVQHIAIDGKTLRGSRSQTLGPLHLVSAWATAAHLSLGQVAVADKSNEITAIPQLLDLLDLKGAFVSIDAMGCQKKIAAKVVGGGGDYVLTVKENQEHLLEDIPACLGRAFDAGLVGYEHDAYGTRDLGHGRRESRSYTLLYDPTGIRGLENWAGLRVIGMCHSEGLANGKPSEETRYFIGSAKASAQEYARVLRNHWGIENNLHWQLDVTFGEDANRVQKRRGAENLALLRRLALSLLKRQPGKKSIACKRIEAALDTGVLEKILRDDYVLGNL